MYTLDDELFCKKEVYVTTMRIVRYILIIMVLEILEYTKNEICKYWLYGMEFYTFLSGKTVYCVKKKVNGIWHILYGIFTVNGYKIYFFKKVKKFVI